MATSSKSVLTGYSLPHFKSNSLSAISPGKTQKEVWFHLGMTISALFHGTRARLYRTGRKAWRVARLWYL
jgi:hypothetical protein